MFGVPESYCYDDLLLVHKGWLGQLLRGRSLPESFPSHSELGPDDLRALLRQRQTPNEEWRLLIVDRYLRKRTTVFPIPAASTSSFDQEELCFAEVLRYVSHSNFVNLWKEAYKTRHDPYEFKAETKSCSFGLEHDVVLLDILSRIHGNCPIVFCNDAVLPVRLPGKGREEVSGHKVSALAVIVDDENISVLRQFQKYSIHHALTFSPAFFGDSIHKLLFVVYQILHGVRDMHSRGLSIGDISLHDILLTGENFIALKPKVHASLVEMSFLSNNVGGDDPLRHLSNESSVMLQSLKMALRDEFLKDNLNGAEVIVTNFLGMILNLWTRGRLSNFDYIMFLNYLCGRKYSNQNYYPVIPWVRDFSGEVGGWRDLSKSKFRLNKGDTQLDLTYDSLNDMISEETSPALDPAAVESQAAHHVTDVLSEITYYVYKARQTSKSVLCKHVRHRWVPAEYPSSMQRLQAWTPDECIPDFFTDPTIFKSIHDDLPDLEIPPWCQSPEDFITWHRASLESSHVSERLHHWIDLTFGYKLSGGSAIRAKNVCLHLVDDHTDLRVNGVVQLFYHPHPSRERFNSYWSKAAPRFDSFLVNQGASDSDFDAEDDELLLRMEQEGDRSRSRASLVDFEKNSADAKSFSLPKDYDPLLRLQEVECMSGFLSKSGTSFVTPPAEKKTENLAKELSQRRIVRDLQVVGCLIMELFLPKKFLALGACANLKARFQICKSVIESEAHLLPSCIWQTLHHVLFPHFKIDSSDRYPPMSESGLPPPSAFQLLLPQVSSLSFPKHFPSLAHLLREIDDITTAAQSAAYCIDDNEEQSKNMRQKVGEITVKLVSSKLNSITDELSVEEIELILPTVKKLLTEPFTAILAAWYLFEPIAKVLGRHSATIHLLVPMLSLYEGATQTSKHLKLYHRTFLQFLIVRFGTQTFLKYFSTFLIEAVGGYRDYEDDSTRPLRVGLERCWNTSESYTRPQSSLSNTTLNESVDEKSEGESSAPPVEETFAEGEVFSFDSLSLNEETDATSLEAKEMKTKGVIYIPPASYHYEVNGFDDNHQRAAENLHRTSGNVSRVAGESVLWLSHRIGPVLTAKYISRNLLRMLNLCYMAPDSVIVQPEKFTDQKIRIGGKKMHGDNLAHHVLECLAEIACLFGDHIILLQYLPYTWELLSLCKKKLTPNLEAGLLGTMALVHHIIPYLSDSLVMKELSDNILVNILFPTLQIMTSRATSFHSGWQLRQALIFKFLDVIYLIGLRIGEEMSRSHLTPLCVAFFSSFDKVYDREGRTLEILCESEESKGVSLELAKVLSPEVAYAAYVAFYNLMGRTHLDTSIINFDVVKTLCLLQQDRGESLPRPATFTCLRGHLGENQNSFSPVNMSSGGNMIGSSSAGGNSLLSRQRFSQGSEDLDLHSLIAKDISSSSSRHLKGNWLAYWEYEIGRAEKDTKFNLKQIKLQSFSGHTTGIKSLFVLDNENSFLSGSRDRMAKVWSLRSQGDGNSNIGCQWTYALHKKSVFSVHYLENVRLAVSCDSTIHVWDPFIGSGVHQVDSQRLGPVHVMTPLASPSPAVIAVTNDSMLHVIDCRLGNVATDLKVSVGSTGLVKVMNSSADGNSIIVGHSSGYISLLDLRTGKVKHAWKGHEGEILNLTPLGNNEFMSTSLDQTVSIWLLNEGKLKCQLSGAQEPVHCVSFIQESGDIVCGTTANRISVRHGSSQDASYHSSKLRTDIIKGNLTAMKVLPMNRQLLVGQDNGQLILMC